VKTEALISFETLTRCNIPEQLNLQQRFYKSLRSLFILCQFSPPTQNVLLFTYILSYGVRITSRTPTILLHVFLIFFCHSKSKRNCIRIDTVEKQEPALHIKNKTEAPWILTVYGVGIPVEEKRFINSPKVPDRLWGPPSPVLNCYHISSPGLKRPAREANHSIPCSAEVTNEWSYPSTFPLWFHSAVKDNW